MNSLKKSLFLTGRRSFSHQLPASLASLRLSARQLAHSLLVPGAKQRDLQASYPEREIDELFSLGYMRLTVPAAAGGRGLDMLGVALVLEELSRGCAATGAIVSIHNCLFADLVTCRGSPEQRARFLPPAARAPGCFALSEPDAGSDAGALQATARRDGAAWRLSGTKAWVTSAPQAGAMVVFANVDPSRKQRGITAFLVPLDAPGVSLGPRDQLMGIRALSCCSVFLDNVLVPDDCVLGAPGEGFKMAMRQLDKARLGISAQALGISQAALDCATSYAVERKAFGRPLAQLPAVQHRLAEMSVRLEGARLLTWRAARRLEEAGEADGCAAAVATAKLAAATCANFAAHNCVQILGGMGYSGAHVAERLYRDARVTEIYGGVTDVQKMIIAQGLIKEHLKTSNM